MRVYLHLLLMADWRYDCKSGREAGDVDVTAKQIALATNTEEHQVRRALQKLEHSNNIKKVELRPNKNRYKVLGYHDKQYNDGVNWLIFPRSLTTLKIYQNTDAFTLFLYFLLSADSEKGSLITTYTALAADKQKVRKLLRQLISEGLISTTRVGNGVKIQITDFEKYYPKTRSKEKTNKKKSRILRTAPDGVGIEDSLDYKPSTRSSKAEKSTPNNNNVNTSDYDKHLKNILDDYF